VRDLLRRRGSLVHQRTALLLSFKSLYARTTGQKLDLSQAKKLEPREAPRLYEHPANQLIAQVQAEHIQALGRRPRKGTEREGSGFRVSSIHTAQLAGGLAPPQSKHSVQQVQTDLLWSFIPCLLVKPDHQSRQFVGNLHPVGRILLDVRLT
jgi:hypothetical protein